MKKTVFFTDPHIGLDRVAHTTVKSRVMLRERLFDSVMSLMDGAVEVHGEEAVQFMCLGDLYDSFSNDENIIKAGADVAARCELVLGGNHDMSNRISVRGSLQLLSDLNVHRNVVIADNRAEPYACVLTDHETHTAYVCVPHALTQELFEQSLMKACTLVGPHSAYGDAWGKLLLLHCNVGMPHDHEMREGQTSLWLTDELAAHVVEIFDHVLVGHEHVPATKYNGKLHILGNVYPFSFGEMADRFCYVYSPEDRILRKVKTIDVTQEYVQISVDALIGAEGQIEVPEYMVEIIGRIKPQDYPVVSRAIVTFWKTNPHLYAVRENIERDAGTRAKVEKDSFVPRTLRQTVGESIKSTPFAAEFASIVKEIDENDGED